MPWFAYSPPGMEEEGLKGLACPAHSKMVPLLPKGGWSKESP